MGHQKYPLRCERCDSFLEKNENSNYSSSRFSEAIIYVVNTLKYFDKHLNYNYMEHLNRL